MTFSTDAVRDGIGRCIRVDMSLDKFATVTARWGTVAGLLDGSSMYSSRIVSMGSVRRGLGQNRVATGSTTSLVLDNSDGALDAYAGRENMSTQSKLRVRIYLVLFDTASPSSMSSKFLGEFSLAEWVRQNDTTIHLQFGDDILGAVGQQALLPTLSDWQAVGTTSNNPIKTSVGIPASIDISTSVQLAFGEDWVLALPHLIPWETPSTTYQGKLIIPVCCTTDTGAGSDYEISDLRIQYFDFGDVVRLYDVPRSFIKYEDGATTERIWWTERSPTITKNGKSFKIIYVVVSQTLGDNYLTSNFMTGSWQPAPGNPEPYADMEAVLYSHKYDGGYPSRAVDWAGNGYWGFGSRALSWFVKGIPLSARTQVTSSVQHSCDVIKDLVSEYSDASVVINETMRGRVKAGNPNAACSGVVQSWVEGPKKGDPRSASPPPSLRQVLTKLCQSADMDVFMTWDGELGFCSEVRDYDTSIAQTAEWDGQSSMGTETVEIQTIPQSACSGIERWVASQGERGAPFSRLYFNGGRSNPAEGVLDAPNQGPFDFENTLSGISSSDRIVEATLDQGWRPIRQQVQTPWRWRSLDLEARDRIRFRTSLSGLFLELGALFQFTWTRGLTGPYTSTLFQCESISYASDDAVEIEAVWRNETTTGNAYLLDDETLLVRSKGALAGAGAWDSGFGWFTFGGTINLLTMGVEVGDILVLRDSTEAADSFLRNACFRIDTVTATYCEILPVMTSTVSVANADWSIVRGATTYPTAISDPSNYPSGGDMYGKVTSVAGVQSNSAAGNKLING